MHKGVTRDSRAGRRGSRGAGRGGIYDSGRCDVSGNAKGDDARHARAISEFDECSDTSLVRPVRARASDSISLRVRRNNLITRFRGRAAVSMRVAQLTPTRPVFGTDRRLARARVHPTTLSETSELGLATMGAARIFLFFSLDRGGAAHHRRRYIGTSSFTGFASADWIWAEGGGTVKERAEEALSLSRPRVG